MALLQQLEGHAQHARHHGAAGARPSQTLGDRLPGDPAQETIGGDVEGDEAREDGGADERAQTVGCAHGVMVGFVTGSGFFVAGAGAPTTNGTDTDGSPSMGVPGNWPGGGGGGVSVGTHQ